MEEWKDIEGYEGIYEVSNTGKVRTKEGKVTHSIRHGIRVWSQRELKPKIRKDKTCSVTLWRDKQPKDFQIHRLVAIAFLDNPENKRTVNHIDGNRLNNNLSNLEWNTHKENNNHAFDNGLIKTGKAVTLINKETGEIHSFRSLSKASLFIGKNHGYLSNHLKKGKKEIPGFDVNF